MRKIYIHKNLGYSLLLLLFVLSGLEMSGQVTGYVKTFVSGSDDQISDIKIYDTDIVQELRIAVGSCVYDGQSRAMMVRYDMEGEVLATYLNLAETQGGSALYNAYTSCQIIDNGHISGSVLMQGGRHFNAVLSPIGGIIDIENGLSKEFGLKLYDEQIDDIASYSSYSGFKNALHNEVIVSNDLNTQGNLDGYVSAEDFSVLPPVSYRLHRLLTQENGDTESTYFRGLLEPDYLRLQGGDNLFMLHGRKRYPQEYMGAVFIGKYEEGSFNEMGSPSSSMGSVYLKANFVNELVVEHVIMMGEEDSFVKLMAFVKMSGFLSPYGYGSDQIVYGLVPLEYNTISGQINIDYGTSYGDPKIIDMGAHELKIEQIDYETVNDQFIFYGTRYHNGVVPTPVYGKLDESSMSLIDFPSEDHTLTSVDLVGGEAHMASISSNLNYVNRIYYTTQSSCLESSVSFPLVDFQGSGITIPISSENTLTEIGVKGMWNRSSEATLIEVIESTPCLSSDCEATGFNLPNFIQVCNSLTLISLSGGDWESITWSNGSTDGMSISVGPGDYWVTVEDMNGCTVTLESTVENVDYPDYEVEVTSPICDAGEGSLEASFIEGGNGFIFSWEGTNSPGIDAPPGVYELEVSYPEIQGCVLSENYTLTSELPDIGEPVGLLTSCDGGAESADLNVDISPDDYQAWWTDGDDDNDFEDFPNGITPEGGVPAGTYTLMLSDGDDCIGVEAATYEVTEPSVSAITFGSTTDYCDLGLTVTAITSPAEMYPVSISLVLDGMPLETISSSDGTAMFTGLGAFEYDVVVEIEGYGCTSEESFDNSSFSSDFELSTTVTPDMCGTGMGQISVSASGGQSPYTYAWDLDGDGEYDDAGGYEVEDLVAGDYTVQVTDANGCEQEEAIAVEEVDVEVIIYQEGCGLQAVALIDGVDHSDEFTYTWIDGTEEAYSGYNSYITPVENGLTYTVTASNSEGCLVSASFVPYIEAVPRSYAICYHWESYPDNLGVPPFDDPIEEEVVQISEGMGSHAQGCADAVSEAFLRKIKDECLNPDNVKDRTSVQFDVAQEHFTLFYHDRMGQLTKTVPPSGVNPGDINDIGGEIDVSTGQGPRTDAFHPLHDLETYYNYNGIGQLISQDSPDTGSGLNDEESNQFIYDVNHRLRFSQTADQREKDEFSYIKYDRLGRMVEGGDLIWPIPLDFQSLNSPAYTDNLHFPVETDPFEYTNRTKIYYSAQAEVSYYGEHQNHLRNRVSYTTHESRIAQADGSMKSYLTNRYYSYDIHGKAEWIVSDLPEIGRSYLRYEYDLVSGNVLQVTYNEKRKDQFYHRYTYDANSRLISTETSTNGAIWDTDASYEYYLHGPLKRVVLGEDELQGLDFVYTINGWLKSINHPDISVPSFDPGNDDVETLSDVFGMSLGYFVGDYEGEINGQMNPFEGYNNYSSGNLFNGNISSWSSSVRKSLGGINEDDPMLTNPLDNPEELVQILGSQYVYDRLNRIKSANYGGNGDIDAFWSNQQDYFATTYSYDANGNIQHLTRNGSHENGGSDVAMDDIEYTYANGNNQLTSINDTEILGVNGLQGDINGSRSYVYDKEGNLISDLEEGIAEIKWNAMGKMEEVIPVFNPDAADNDDIVQKPWIKYVYDDLGQRAMKIINAEPFSSDGAVIIDPYHIDLNTRTTYYQRDHSGNVMATYTRHNQVSDGGDPDVLEASFELLEQPIYGTGRVGQRMNLSAVNAEITQLDYNPSLTQPEIEVDVPFIIQGEYTHHAMTAKLLDDNLNASEMIGVNTNTLLAQAQNPDMGFFTADLSVAVGENRSGEVQFYAGVNSVEGTNFNVLALYDKNLNIMPGVYNEYLNVDKFSRPMVMQHPEIGHLYYVYYRTVDGYLKYLTVDMSQIGLGTAQDPLGEFSVQNVALTDEVIGRNMAVVESHFDDVPSTLFYTTYQEGSGTRIRSIQMVNGEWSETEMAASDSQIGFSTDPLGNGDIAVSPDLSELSIYILNGTPMPPSHMQYAYVLRFGLDDDLHLTGIIENQYIEQSNASFSQLEYDQTGQYLYATSFFPVPGDGSITVMDERVVQLILGFDGEFSTQLNLASNVTSDHISKVCGGLQRGVDGGIYMALDQSYYKIINSSSSSASLEEVDITLGNTLALTGSMSNNPIRVWPECSNCDEGVAIRYVGEKVYEISDHLGNVRVAISDRRKVMFENPMDENSVIEVSAEVLTYNNYYPFGMQITTMSYADTEYRNGFNGQENDDEIKGRGNWVSYEYRNHDSRIGRFVTMDPLTTEYSFQSPYVFAGNFPVKYVDISGLGPGPKEKKISLRKANRYQQDQTGRIKYKYKDKTNGTKGWIYADEDSTTKSVMQQLVDIDYSNLEFVNYTESGTYLGGEIYGSNNNLLLKGLMEATVTAQRIKKTSLRKAIYDVIGSIDFTADVSGRVDVGVQAGAKLSAYGGHLKAKVNLASFEVASGHIDLANTTDRDGSYIGDGDGNTVKQSISLVAGFNGRDYLGFTGAHQFETYGSGSFNEQTYGNIYLIVPLFDKKSKTIIETPDAVSVMQNSNVQYTPVHLKSSATVKGNVKADVGKSFFGLDFGAGAALILGVEVNVKIGFYYD